MDLKNDMKKKAKEPYTPVERRETVRQKILALIEHDTLSAKDISLSVGVSEREVYEHLEHIQRSVRKQHFLIMPAVCKKCRFVFRKRDKLKKPGRCPVCHSELIQEPLFSIRKLHSIP